MVYSYTSYSLRTSYTLRINISLLIILCLIFSWAGSVRADELPIDFKLNSGYRIDNLHWNIAGDLTGANPNILSELTWTKVRILQINGLATAPLRQSLFLQGSMNWGVIILGNNQDSDYQGDNRTQEFSRSNNNGNGDNALDLSVALGYNLTGNKSKFRLAPMIGFAFNQQNLRLTDGYQTINIDPDTKTVGDTGPISGLNSTYKASWFGPWLGTGFTGNLSPKLTLLFGFEYHLANYYGEGNWNLRDDLTHPISFTHNADGNGYIWSAGANFSPSPQLNLTLKYYSSAWFAGPGIDRVFGADGAMGETCLNEVIWNSRAVMLILHWNL